MRPPLPDFCRRVAVKEGVPEHKLEGLWEDHLDYCDREGIHEYGGMVWRRLCESVGKEAKANPSLPNTSTAEERALRRRAREAELLCEQEYLRDALSLREWLQTLRERAATLQALTPLEAHLARVRAPILLDGGTEWGVDLMTLIEGAPQQGRTRECADCGRPPMRWVRLEHVYYGAYCETCWERRTLGRRAAAS